MSDSIGRRVAAVAAAIVGAGGSAIEAEARRPRAAGGGFGDPGPDRDAIQDRFDDRLRDRIAGDDGARNIWDDWFDDPDGGGGNGGNGGGGGGNLNWFPFS